MKHLWKESLLDGNWDLYYEKAEFAAEKQCVN